LLVTNGVIGETVSLQFKAHTDFIVIVGVKESGKTTLTIHYVKQLDRFIYIDPTWQVGSLGYVVHYPERIVKAAMKFNKVVYQPSHTKTKEAYSSVFQACLSLTNYTLVIDEIDAFAKPRWYICEELEALICRGRIQGIGLICNTRRPHKIHNDIRSNADHVICFKLHEKRDLDYMAEWLNIDKSQIKGLGRFHSLYFDVHGLTVKPQSPLY